MTELIDFTPQRTKVAKENLSEFITYAKTLTVFGSPALWENNTWRTVKGDRTVPATFSKLGEPAKGSVNYMDKPFVDFAKAYIKYTYSNQPLASVANQLLALRVLETVLLTVYGKADISLLDGRGLSRISDVVAHTNISDAVKNKMGYQLEKILCFCRRKLITPTLPEWKNSYPKQKDITIDMDAESQQKRHEKLPSDEEMFLLADLFRQAPSLGIEVEYYSACFVFLMLAPSRVSELIHLKVNPFVYETSPVTHKKRMGIRWHPAKGAKDGIKWVPSELEPFVLEAHERLVKIGNAAREAAQFAIDYPEAFPLENGQRSDELLNPYMPLTGGRFNELMGFADSDRFPDTIWVNALRSRNHGDILLQALAEHQYALYTKPFKSWPSISSKQKALVSESLLLVRNNELHKTAGTTPFSFVLPTVNMINERLSGKVATEGKNGARSTVGKKSLLEEFDFKLSDGSYPKLTTHQPRHWVSTQAERAGIGEVKLAQWAGRARVRDNDAYDHRSELEKARDVALVMHGDEVPLHVKVETKMPVLFHEVGKDLDGAAIVTELGVCVHDYTMAPCGRQRDCETCKQMVCIKGFSSSVEYLKKREKDVLQQFKKAQQQHEMGAFGTDRWVTNQGWRLAHIRTKIKLLSDARIPDGTPIKIPDRYDSSPIKQAIEQKGMDIEVIDDASTAVANGIFKLMEL